MNSVSSNYALRLRASLKREVEKLARAEFFAERAGRGDATAALEILSRRGGESPREDDRL